MKVIELMEAIYQFRKPKTEPNGYVSLLSRGASGVIIGHEAFRDLINDPDSFLHIYTKPDQPFRHWIMDIPLYRSGDIDSDKYEIF